VVFPVGWEGVLSKGGTRDGGGEVGVEKLTMGEAGSKGVEVEAAPASKDVKDVFRTGGVDDGTGVSVRVGAGVDTVDIISLMSGPGQGATISCCAVPSRERDNVAAGGISCSAVVTAPGGDASVERGLVRAGKAGKVVAGG
jgi:hypothetical protein